MMRQLECGQIRMNEEFEKERVLWQMQDDPFLARRR